MPINDEDNAYPAERKPLREMLAPYRDQLLETSRIPALGLTFAEVEAKLLAAHHLPEGDQLDAVLSMASHIHITPPKSVGDALVKLRILAGDLGMQDSCSEEHLISVRQLLDFATAELGGASYDDPFSAAFSDLKAVAVEMLSNPDSWSAAALTAGASAAGTSAERFRAGLAASLDAIKKERAA